MMATQGGSPEELASAVVNVINDHIRTEGVDARKLPQAETELLLLNMRAKSVGEEIELIVNDPDDGSKHEVTLSLNEIGIEIDKEFTDTIELSGKRMLKLNTPNINTASSIDPNASEFDSTIEVLVNCFSSISDEDETYAAEDLEKKDIEEFFLDLSSGDFKVITDKFFSKLPKLATTIKVPRAGKDDLEVQVEGLASFL